jgi:hypothetical protein
MLHKLKRMDATMGRFLGSAEALPGTEPGDLKCEHYYRRYVDDPIVQFNKDAYARLNSIWKQIFQFAQAFSVTATASSAILDISEVYDAWERNPAFCEMIHAIEFSIHLECRLFEVDVYFVHVEQFLVNSERERERWISYSTDNMHFKRQATNLAPIKFFEKKMLHNSVAGNISAYNKEAEDKDALFVAYDVLSSLQRVLRYNKVLSNVVFLRPTEPVSDAQRPNRLDDLPDDIKYMICDKSRKDAAQEATTRLKSLLAQYNPDFNPAMSLKYARASNLTGGPEPLPDLDDTTGYWSD